MRMWPEPINLGQALAQRHPIKGKARRFNSSWLQILKSRTHWPLGGRITQRRSWILLAYAWGLVGHPARYRSSQLKSHLLRQNQRMWVKLLINRQMVKVYHAKIKRKFNWNQHPRPYKCPVLAQGSHVHAVCRVRKIQPRLSWVLGA